MVPEKDYEGVIVVGNNTSDTKGKYPVFIPELNVSLSNEIKPFWMTNEITGNVLSRWKIPGSDEVYSAGSYFPLSEGMKVNVRFRTDSYNSGYINRIKTNSPLLYETVLRDDHYLINKTKRGSYILQDDATGETHISNLMGKTNIILDNDRILLKVTEGGKVNGGTVSYSGFEIEKTGMTYNIGNVTFRVDETGITMNVGDNIFSMTESGTSFFTNKLNLETESQLNIKSGRLKLTGTESLDLFSNDTKITGNTNLNLTGHNIKVEADPLGSVHLNGAYLSLQSLITTSIMSPNIDMKAITNLSISSPILSMHSTVGTISATTLALDSATTLMDGTILSNMGVAKSLAVSSLATNTALNTGLYATYMGLSMSTSMSDPISGAVNSTLVSLIPGSSNPIGYNIKPFNIAKVVGADISQKLAKVISSDNFYKENHVTLINGRIRHGIKLS